MQRPARRALPSLTRSLRAGLTGPLDTHGAPAASQQPRVCAALTGSAPSARPLFCLLGHFLQPAHMMKATFVLGNNVSEIRTDEVVLCVRVCV